MITTSTILPPPVQAHFDRALLAVPYPNLIHGLVAQYREMPAHGGNTWRGRRYNRLQTATVPLGKLGAEIKSFLIDLEALWGDKAQAFIAA